MFGQPHWFSAKSCCLGLRPASWQGWFYGLVWLGILLVPFVGFLSAERVVESLIWIGGATCFLMWDIKEITAKMESGLVQIDAKEEDEDVLYISDDENTQLATNNYDLHIRD